MSLRCLGRTSAALFLTAPLFLAGSARPEPSRAAGGRVYLTLEEALDLAFPDCEVRKETVYLTAQEAQRAGDLAEVDVGTRIVRPYVARKEGVLVGTAYFDSHEVRTHRETLMVVVDPRDRIQRLELLAFAEPEEYVPRGKWYGQFLGRRLDEELNLKRGIRGIAGATLSARATTRAARRVLALHQVLAERLPPEDAPHDAP